LELAPFRVFYGLLGSESGYGIGSVQLVQAVF
jgi:hypothetical protein